MIEWNWFALIGVVWFFLTMQLNGLVIDIGNRMQIIPINDGVIEKHATTQLKKGVTNTSKYMADLLQDKGTSRSLHYFLMIYK